MTICILIDWMVVYQLECKQNLINFSVKPQIDPKLVFFVWKFHENRIFVHGNYSKLLIYLVLEEDHNLVW